MPYVLQTLQPPNNVMVNYCINDINSKVARMNRRKNAPTPHQPQITAHEPPPRAL